MIQYIVIFLLANCASTLIRAGNKGPPFLLPDDIDIPLVPEEEAPIVGKKSECFPLNADLELYNFIQQNIFDISKGQYSDMMYRYQVVNGYKYEVFIKIAFSNQVTNQKIVVLRNALGFSVMSIEDATEGEC
jgi:hypothetical protein